MVDTKSIEDKIINHLRSERPPAIVLGSDRAHGLALVRSLGRQGIRVVALNRSHGPGRHSRYALNADLTADLDQAALLGLCGRIGQALPQKPFLIPASDQFVLFIARNRTELSRHYSFVVLDTATAELIANKRTQYEYAEAANVPLPRTVRVATADDV
jgi:predicted ATP-grasp superfamily ATP-dependent carboligase